MPVPFPLSIITDEVSQELDECAQFLRAHRLDAVEVRTVSGRRVPDVASADRATVGRWVRDQGFRVVCVSPGTFKGDVQDRARIRRECDEVVPRALELCDEWRAPFLVTFGFENPTGDPAPGYAVDALRAATGQCAAAGVRLLLENEPGFCAGTAAETRALCDRVDHPGLGVNWDPCNSNEYAPAQLAAALTALGDRIGNVHVKNGRREAGARFPRYGSLRDGDIDWLAHLRQLRDAGYAGHLGIETHFEPLAEGSRTLVAELRAMLQTLDDGGDDRSGEGGA